MLKYQLPLRLIVSVIAGIIIAMVLSVITHEILHLAGIFPALGKPMFDTNLLWISLAYHSLYALIAAYFTAMIAEKKAKKATFILGTKEAIMWLLGTILLWHHAAPWYNITKALLGVPIAMLGGEIYARHLHKKSTVLKNYHRAA
ncbi:MAG: hypothetical protein V4635_07145 [Bacteroidota bacterium]